MKTQENKHDKKKKVFKKQSSQEQCFSHVGVSVTE